MMRVMASILLICLPTLAQEGTHSQKGGVERPASDSALREAGMVAVVGRLRVLPSAGEISVANEADLWKALGRVLGPKGTTTAGELVVAVRNRSLTPEQWTSLRNTLDPLIQAQKTIGDNGRTELVELGSQIDELLERIGDRSAVLTATATTLKTHLAEARTLRDLVAIQDAYYQLRLDVRALTPR